MNTLLHDLIAHMEWADAEHWKALETHPGALEDDSIRKRLYHYHFTQWGFLTIIQGKELKFPSLDDLPDLPTFRQIVVHNHHDITRLVEKATDAELGRQLTIPWFQEPPLAISMMQALAQVATHSQYHRGQNATRLRELGGTPPTTDLITWYWKGRPAAVWG